RTGRHPFRTRPLLEILEDRTLLDGGGFSTVALADPYATQGGNFGHVVELQNGNLVVTAPNASVNGIVNAGAVYLYNGTSGALISTLKCSHPKDQIGSEGVVALSNGNYVVISKNWNNERGALTWINGTTGLDGAVSGSNSLVGGNGHS